MTAYGPLARFYDRLTEDVDYQGLYQYLCEHFSRSGVTVRRILDMACGTGSLTALFAQSGVQAVGMDLSPDMLSQAREKASVMETPPLYLQGDMADFSLDTPVDAVVCMLDSFNYLTEPADGVSALTSFYDALMPGGLLIYDVRPRKQLMEFDGQVFLDENEDILCLWRTEFDFSENLCYYGMDLFLREGENWHREREEHVEYAYRLRWLRMEMERIGFRDIRFFGDRTFSAPTGEDPRVFITARRE